MKKFKSHFWYNRSQRNGILLLITIIICSQILYFYVDFYPSLSPDKEHVAKIRIQLDSLLKLQEKKNTPKIYPFNPNFISDFKGYQLGMTLDEIDRLHEFREKGKFVNSKIEFQKVTLISDSLLAVISPYFKFPDWVKKQNKNSIKNTTYSPIINDVNKISTKDLNRALASDFATLKSVNESLANRIVNYRNKIKGYTYKDQLTEVWKINQNQIDEILKVFSIETKPDIKKININTASFKEVLSIPYIDYELCKKLFEFRDEVAELQSISEIKNIEGFPINKYDRIVLYLFAE